MSLLGMARCLKAQILKKPSTPSWPKATTCNRQAKPRPSRPQLVPTCKARRSYSGQASQSDISKPRAVSSGKYKAEPGPTNASDEEKVCTVHTMFTVLEDVVEGIPNSAALLDDFSSTAHLGAKIGAFDKWFLSRDEDNIIKDHNLVDILLKAHYAERIPHLLPFLASMFAVLPECSPAITPHVAEILTTMSDIRFRLPNSCKDSLDTLAAVFSQPLQQEMQHEEDLVAANTVSSSPADSQQVQQQVQHQPVTGDTTVRSSLGAPGGQAHHNILPVTMSPDYVAIARNDDLSPTAFEAYQMLITEPDRSPKVERTARWMHLRDLQQKLGAAPHGRLTRRAYIKNQTNVYHFDFNEEMSKRRREMQRQQQCSVAPDGDDVSTVLSPAMDVGFAGGQDDDSGGEVPDQASEADPYL